MYSAHEWQNIMGETIVIHERNIGDFETTPII